MCIHCNRERERKGKKTVIHPAVVLQWALRKRVLFARRPDRVCTRVITYGYPVANTEIRARQHANPLLANQWAVHTCWPRVPRFRHSSHIVITVSVAKPGGTFAKLIVFVLHRPTMTIVATKVIRSDTQRRRSFAPSRRTKRVTCTRPRTTF